MVLEALAPMSRMGLVGVLVVSGCTMDVGEGTIPPVIIDTRFSYPTSMVRGNVPEGTWTDANGGQLLVRQDEKGMFVSVSKEIMLFTAGESEQFGGELRGKSGAVQRIDVIVKDCQMQELQGLPAEAVLEGITLGYEGKSEARFPLPGDTRERVIDAIDASEAVMVNVGVQVSFAPEQLKHFPTGVELWLVLQPVLVIDKLKAL